LFGGATPDLVKIWSIRAALVAVLVAGYALARNQWHMEKEEV
jgi:hypothetical protein